MFAGRVSDVHIVFAAGILMVAAGFAGAILTPPPNAVDTGTSTFSAGPQGTKAAYLALGDLGYRVERSFEPITALRAAAGSTVLVISGQELPSNQDRRAIRRFLQEGGVVVAAGASGAELLGLSPPRGTSHKPELSEDVETHGPLWPSPLAVGVREITMPIDVMRVTLPDVYVPVFGTSQDTVGVATATVGKGRVVWWTAPTPITNAHIDDADNLQLLLNVIGDAKTRTTVFDEHYQGHKRSLWSYAAGTPLPGIAFQAGLIALAALLTYSRRSGPIRPIRVDPRTSPLEFVNMLGALYKRAGARAAAVAATRGRVRRTLAVASGIPLASTDDAVAGAAGAVLGIDARTIADLLTESDRAARNPDLAAATAVDVTRRLQALAGRLRPARRTATGAEE